MITLQHFTEADFQRLIGWIDSENFLIQFGGQAFSYPLTEPQLAQYLHTANRKAFAIKLQDTNTIIGHCELAGIDLKHKSATFCRLLIGKKTLRGKGFGYDAVIEAIKYGFDEIGLHRIDINVFDFNKGAIALYKKIGFQEEGVLRDYCKVGNDYWSAIRMSILEKEYKNLYQV